MRDPNFRRFWTLGITGVLLMPIAAMTQSRPYRLTEAIHDMSPDQTGVAVATRTVGALADKADTLVITKDAHKAYEFWNSVVSNVDFDRVLDAPIALKLANNASVFTLSGTQTAETYKIDYHKSTFDSVPLHELADFAVQMQVQENKNPATDESAATRGFGISVQGQLDTGEISHRTVSRLFSNLFAVMDPQNLKTLAPIPSPLFTEVRAADRKAIDEIYASLPLTYQMLDKYVQIVPYYKIKEQDRRLYTEVSLKVTLLPGNMEQDYPELGHFLLRLFESFEFSGGARYYVQDRCLGEFTVDSAKQSLVIVFNTAQGAIVPYDARGRMDFGKLYNPATITSSDSVVLGRLYGRVMGLTMTANNITVITTFRDGPQAVTTSKLTQFPPPKITGRALGIFPTWAINAFIPGNLDGYCKMFTRALLLANHGEGTVVRITADTRSPLHNQLSIAASTELLDNFFLNFGLRIVQGYIWPNEDVIADAWRLARKFVRTVSTDCNNLQAATAMLAH